MHSDAPAPPFHSAEKGLFLRLCVCTLGHLVPFCFLFQTLALEGDTSEGPLLYSHWPVSSHHVQVTGALE